MPAERPQRTLSGPGGPHVLASDRERERAVALLRDGGAEGRLTPQELEERVERALGARTRGELASVIGDLPDAAAATKPASGVHGGRSDMRRQVAIYAAVNLLLVVVWAISGAGYFWPIWPLLGWGLGLAKHRVRHGAAGHRGASRARQWTTS
ncbi:MAG TPA: DUF1707 domain-containing protein [Thermoleophilaceae bacterium]|nr:DUF1707 domain-containing protein [Thermoleophilaceae bacterium]